MSQPSNRFILIPEIAIEKVISTIIKFIREDYKSNDEESTYLYYLCNSVFIERLDVFKEAKKIFIISDEHDPKRIKINLGYPQTISDSINITITHSGEQYATNAIGVDQSPDVYEEYADNDTESDSWRNDYGRRYNATYQVIITGSSTNETLIVYNILKSVLISFEGTAHLNAVGFENVRITGQDTIIKTDVNKRMYSKNLVFTFEYEYRVPDTNRAKYWNNLIFKQFLKDE